MTQTVDICMKMKYSCIRAELSIMPGRDGAEIVFGDFLGVAGEAVFEGVPKKYL